MRTSNRKILLFCILFLAVNALLSYLIIPPDYTRSKIRALEKNNYDGIIFGTSHGASALDPAYAEEESGKTFYNAAAGGLYPRTVYYLLKDVLRSYRPETVVLEYDPSYYVDEDGGNPNGRYAISCMEPSFAKARLFLSDVWERDFRYAFMPWYMQRSQIRTIPENAAKKRTEAYRSYSMELFGDENMTVREDGFVAVHGTYMEEGETPSYGKYEGGSIVKNESYMEKTIALCKKEGIRTLVVLTPVPAETYTENKEFYDTASGRMREIAEEYSASFLDFVTERGETCELPDDAFYDREGHMHEHAAAVFSKQCFSQL